MSQPFRLTKWYLDITTEEGTCFIGYAAMLQWKRISIGYKGYLYLDHQKSVHKSNSFQSSRLPEMLDDVVRWQTDYGTGTWHRLDPAIDETLLHTPQGIIHWNCALPRSNASFKRKNGNTIAGLGYAEKMELTLPPWDIPIDTLYWGRYVSASNSVVWIEWKGPVPKLLIFLNGTKYEAGTIDNTGITFGSYTLRMTTRTTLRAGSIGATVFARFRKIMALFPLSIFRLQENKWTGTATLSTSENVTEEGKYIHEEVNWK
jgi:hypothetical protein